jgi:hypothetical protein
MFCIDSLSFAYFNQVLALYHGGVFFNIFYETTNNNKPNSNPGNVMLKSFSYLNLCHGLGTWYEAMFAQQKNQRNLDSEEGVPHTNAVAGSLPKHQHPKLIGRVLWCKIFWVKNSWVLEVLLIPA